MIICLPSAQSLLCGAVFMVMPLHPGKGSHLVGGSALRSSSQSALGMHSDTEEALVVTSLVMSVIKLLVTCSLHLLQGLKLQYGHVPLYVHGDDSKSKQFTSLHGVQRHMVDANKCKMAFDDNEEEYLEFYDWSKLEDELTGSFGLLAVACFGSYAWG